MYGEPLCNHSIVTEEERIKDMVKDLVCGMEIEEMKSKATYGYEGQTYYFCAPECKDQFVDLASPQMNSELPEKVGRFLEMTEIHAGERIRKARSVKIESKGAWTISAKSNLSTSIYSAWT